MFYAPDQQALPENAFLALYLVAGQPRRDGRMFFSQPNELHPSGPRKTGLTIAEHVPVRSISISLIYFSEPTRNTRSSVGVAGEPPPAGRFLPASGSSDVIAPQQRDTRGYLGLGVPQDQRRERAKGRVYTCVHVYTEG